MGDVVEGAGEGAPVGDSVVGDIVGDVVKEGVDGAAVTCDSVDPRVGSGVVGERVGDGDDRVVGAGEGGGGDVREAPVGSFVAISVVDETDDGAAVSEIDDGMVGNDVTVFESGSVVVVVAVPDDDGAAVFGNNVAAFEDCDVAVSSF